MIRPATSDDIPRLVPLIREYWTFEGIGRFDESRVSIALRQLLGTPNLGGGWIAANRDGPVGYLLAVYAFSLEHAGLTAEIDEFYVRAASRGRGLGLALLNAAESAFVAAGCTNVSLQLGRDNEAARRFYRRRGYRERSGFELMERDL